MNCPQCHNLFNTLTITTTDGQEKNIYECLDCGGHFLDNYLVNFISQDTAKNIDSVIPKKHNEQTGDTHCPTCGQRMFTIKDDDGVPKTVTVYNCPNNHGDFFPLSQLLNFKKAQDAKINYHKLWGIPLKTAFSVIIPLFILFTSITVLPSIIKNTNTKIEDRVKASELTSTPLITPLSETEVLISFSTTSKSNTNIVFTLGQEGVFKVSESPDTNHIIKISNLKPSTTYQYYIVIDPNNRNQTTNTYTFSTP